MIYGFDPISSPTAGRLILGTIPGRASLDAGQYYRHPRNAFWFIVEALSGKGKGLDYAARQALLIESRIALWDVLQAADRKGSLDSGIVPGRVVPNDFVTFFHRHPLIHTVYFNGSTARTLFRRYVEKALPSTMQLTYVVLPSTSPANARLTADEKLRIWSNCFVNRIM